VFKSIGLGRKFVYTDSFVFEGITLKLFPHVHNVGVITGRMTERAIELALADHWLTERSDVCEVGAVTPYYWPGRVKRVIDPFDPSEFVTDRVSLFERSFSGLDVLSISTIEHVGSGDYGLQKNESAIEALRMIVSQARSFFITIPLGYNKILDDYCYHNRNAMDASLVVFSRNRVDNRWKMERSMRRSYRYGPLWANAIAVLTKCDERKE
jgi:hypothetical protein